MADDALILDGFYAGIPISIRSGGVSGGRKTSIKQFPGRDTQSIEDLGLKPRSYQVEIVVNDKPAQDYFSYRDSLVAALESSTPQVLIHPLFGRIESVVSVSYELNENLGEFGNATVSVNFEVNNNTGIPQQAINVSTQVVSNNDNIRALVNSDIANSFTVTSSFAGNFQAAVDKVNEIIDAANGATEFIGEEAETLNEFSAQIGELSANVNSLVSNPIALADAVTGLFESVNGLYASSGATFDTFVGFFGFGENDIEITQDTAIRIERQKNNDVLNRAVAALSLGYAYESASKQTFQTTLEIDTVANSLDQQYELVQEVKVSEPDSRESPQAIKDAVTDTRITLLKVFDQQRVNASQIISVETVTTSTRLLAFDYYGNDEQGQQITDLNDFTDINFIRGNVDILTV